MESVLIFIGKWFIMLPICIGIVIMPFYLLGAFVRGAFKDFRRAGLASPPSILDSILDSISARFLFRNFSSHNAST